MTLEVQKWFVPKGRLTIKKGRCFLYIVFKIVSLLNQLDESDLQPILDLAIKLMATEKSAFNFEKRNI